MPETERRLDNLEADMKNMSRSQATAEANIANLSKTQEAIFTYMREGRVQREEMIKGFTTLTEQSKATLDYQIACTSEREKLNDRTTSLETTRTRQYGVAAGISLVVTSIGACFAWLTK